jgi:hypothetical protein
VPIIEVAIGPEGAFGSFRVDVLRSGAGEANAIARTREPPVQSARQVTAARGRCLITYCHFDY